MKTAAILFAAAATLAAANTAHAAPPQAQIKIDAAELLTEAGQAQLRSEIRRAARHVCGGTDTRNLHRHAHRAACIADAVAQGDAQLERRIADAQQRRFADADRAARGG